MTRHRRQSFLQQIHVLEKRARVGIRQLRRAIPAHRDQPLAVDAKRGTENPILMVIHLADLFPRGDIEETHRFIRATEGELRPIG